ncbi:AAA family ATPase [Puniceicoccus vermicola]|uniref:SMC family ATPase n=1 Tax=Puniceicoccus vermicola TaxID=388746 RepID=A0A7X1AVZ9_9BACT|nr:SMC family ATPase [Puniceicoccus vermicola]MBC2601013.1 SMC family ATPase [Puniceicoccus vermicola]
MILKRITVSNWRSLLDEVELGPFSEGLNVIHAPNGTGKSSLFEAMRRGLFDAHHVAGGEIAAVQPWGRDLTPSVAIEFIEGDETWRVEKSFLAGKSSKLLRLEGGAFKPVADGRNADDRIREILSAEAPGRGLSKQEHWGLAQILWAPQGALYLESISGTASERIKATLGVQISGDGGGQIENGIEEKYLEFFTKKGSYKGGKNAAPIVTLQEKRDELAEQLISIREKHLAYEQTAHSVEDARQRRLQARREADALRDTVNKARTNAEAYSKLKAEQSNKRDAESLAREKYDSLTTRQKQIKETRDQISEFTKSAKEQESKLSDLKIEETSDKEACAKLRTAQETARKKRSQVTERQNLIEDAREYREHNEGLRELNKRLEQIAQLNEQLIKAKRRQDGFLAPTAQTIRDLRKWLAQRDQAAASLKASQIHLSITPENAIEVKNTTDHSVVKVEAKQAFEISGDDWVDVSIKGFGSIRASGPEGSADEHRAELDAAKKKIETLAQPFGTEDPDKLQELREQADQIEREIKGHENRIQDILDEDELDALKKEQVELQARISETEKEYPKWKEEAPVIGELKSDYESFSKEIEDTISAAEDAFEQAQSKYTAAEKNVAEATAELKIVQGKLETANQQLKDQLSDGLSDDDRAKAISDALMAWQAAKTNAEKTEEALKQYPDDPSKEVDKLEKQLVALEDSESKARDEENKSEGQLQSLAAEGTYSKLVSAEEQISALESEIEQESIRMDAIKLLYDSVEECKSRMVASVSAPVERSASRMLSRIVGPRLGRLKLTGDFVPEAVSPEIASESVPLHNLSGGEQEQLYLVARLALADVLAKNRRQLVVLDDVLNATDSGRLARLLSLMEEVSDRLQIIILTCHPERYRALDKAEFFELN